MGNYQPRDLPPPLMVAGTRTLPLMELPLPRTVAPSAAVTRTEPLMLLAITAMSASA